MKRSLSSRDSKELECSADSKRKKIDTEAILTGHEQPTEQLASHSTSKPIDIFDLNGVVLRNIFSYCSVVDLYSMANDNDQLRSLILENGISGRMIDFGELADCCHILDVFKVFGKQITKIKIGEKDVQYKQRTLSNLDEIMRLISTYCSMDTIKYLELQYFYKTSIRKAYVNAVLPFFRAIESFTIKETDPSGKHHIGDYLGINPKFNPDIDYLVERTVCNAINITSINIVRLKITGWFFYAQQVSNLKNVRIVNCNLKAPDGFLSFLKRKPKLNSFIWDKSSLFGLDSADSHSSNVVFELIANYVPGLEYFVYNQNEGYINDLNEYDVNGLFLRPNYQLLRHFKNLKVLRVPTITLDCLKLLAQMNTVQKLAAKLPSRVSETDLNFLQSFTSLKSITFHTFECGESDRLNYLSQLPQLTECQISVSAMYRSFGNVIVKAVESAKDLSVLRIQSTDPNYYMEVDLYAKLLHTRLAHGHSAKRLVLYSNSKFLKKDFISRLGQDYRPDVIEISRIRSARYPYFYF